MPIISRVGRKAPHIRALIAGIYLVLILGALSMIYPFILMLSHSVSSDVDKDDYRLIPRYFYDDNVLHKKYLEDKYTNKIKNFNDRFGMSTMMYKLTDKPEVINEKFVNDWFTFKRDLPHEFKEPVFRGEFSRSTKGRIQSEFQRFVVKKYGTDISNMNVEYMQGVANLGYLRVEEINLLDRKWFPKQNQKRKDWLEFKKTLSEDYLFAVSGDGKWGTYLKGQFKSDLKSLNNQTGSSYASFSEIPLTKTVPDNNPMLMKYWKTFVLERWPYRYMEVDASVQPDFQAFCEKRYITVENYNNKHKKPIASFTDLSIPADRNTPSTILVDWGDFLYHVPLGTISLITVDNLFREHLLKQHQSLDAINSFYNTKYANVSDIRVPYHEADWVEVMRKKTSTKLFYLARNYVEVFKFITLHGRALVVTIFYISIVIATTLTVNPLCAYALSRFNLSYSFKVLLFLLVTMAFPAEVSMIPNFLLLKQLNMLNTYWALFLPGMANGFSIFILKGFFDSLPRELYEAATIDGASEITVYRKITFQLAKPVLAYITLMAFMHAYGAFWYALIVCQDSQMWTLMVWIYEMQNWAPDYMLTAAMTMAAIPSLVVFAVCQNVIMRGIILPVSN